MQCMQPSPDDLLVQMRKGVVEFCILAHLKNGPAYGHQIADELGKTAAFGSRGSLYPLLARLRRQGWVETTWQESPHGAARRYYVLTPDGRAVLNTFMQAWSGMSASVEQLLGEAR